MEGEGAPGPTLNYSSQGSVVDLKGDPEEGGLSQPVNRRQRPPHDLDSRARFYATRNQSSLGQPLDCPFDFWLLFFAQMQQHVKLQLKMQKGQEFTVNRWPDPSIVFQKTTDHLVSSHGHSTMTSGHTSVGQGISLYLCV